MARYFAAAPPADAAWAVFFLTGRRLKRLRARPRHSATGRSPPPASSEWLLGECYAVVGDGAETAALILDQLPVVAGSARADAWPSGSRSASCRCGRRRPDAQQRAGDRLGARARALGAVHAAQAADRRAARRRVADAGRAGAGAGGGAAGDDDGGAADGRVDAVGGLVRRRWSRPASPTPIARGRIRSAWPRRSTTRSPTRRRSRPLLGERARLAGRVEVGRHPRPAGRRAAASVYLWSRGEELITDRFPEIARRRRRRSPDGTVLDGEVLAWRGDRPLPFSALQQRIGRERQVARKARDVPVVFMAYDILEHDGVDVRGDAARSIGGALLEAIVGALPRRARRQPRGRAPGAAAAVRGRRRRHAPGSRRRRSAVSPRVDAARLGGARRLRGESRQRGVEGLMLKRLDLALRRRPQARRLVEVEDRSAHHRRGADLRAAGLGQARQPAHRLHLRRLARRRAGAGGQGLLRPDQRGDRRDGSLDPPPHGRAVRPGAARRAGARLRAGLRGDRADRRAIDPGIAVRFPRMLRWRKDKPAREADTLATLEALMQSASAGARSAAELARASCYGCRSRPTSVQALAVRRK